MAAVPDVITTYFSSGQFIEVTLLERNENNSCLFLEFCKTLSILQEICCYLQLFSEHLFQAFSLAKALMLLEMYESHKMLTCLEFSSYFKICGIKT